LIIDPVLIFRQEKKFETDISVTMIVLMGWSFVSLSACPCIQGRDPGLFL